MTDQQKQWFDALTQDRADSANMLEKPSMRGIQRSVVDKYSDQAHFIYELLQNADDVHATEARFILRSDGLSFFHNGNIHFSITNPTTEDEDTKSKNLGHVNAITSIANSNKTQSSIGKFGVGFKAVFQFTKTPYIYDPEIRFRIERFIVPQTLESDFDGRKTGETVFWFPFNHDKKPANEAYADIAEKLKSLVFPTLFLTHLEEVSYKILPNGKICETSGSYSKTVSQPCENEYSMTARYLSLTSDVNGKEAVQRLLLFSRPLEEDSNSYSVGFFLESNHLVSATYPAFCFFPTKETTNLDFIIHAPFLLTDSREGIKAGEEWNRKLVQNLAKLAADSLLFLRDINFIADTIFKIIPYKEAVFSDENDRRKISFKPFYSAIYDRFKSEEILPAANDVYSSRDHSYWASDTDLTNLFNDEQLSLLTGTKDAHWVFTSLGKKEVSNSKKVLSDYIDGGDAHSWVNRPSNLIIQSLDPESLLRKITAEFIQKQPQKWLHSFYAYLADRLSYQRLVKNSPIFLDQDGKAVSAFDEKDQLILFLPDDDTSGYITVDKELLANKNTREFIEKFGIKKSCFRDEVYNKIIPQYSPEASISQDTCLAHFMKFFRYFKECRNDEVDDFIALIKDKMFLLCKSADDENVYRCAASQIYMPTDDLRAWFATKSDTRFLLLDVYREKVGEKDWHRLDTFLFQLGVVSLPKICERRLDYMWHDKIEQVNRAPFYLDMYLDGCEQIITHITVESSILVWKLLVALAYSHRFEYSLLGRYTHIPYRCRKPQPGTFASFEQLRLRSDKWILNKFGELVSATDVTIQTLSDKYDTTSHSALDLIKFLGIHDESQNTAHLSKEQRWLIERGKRFENVSDEEWKEFEAFKQRKASATTSENELTHTGNAPSPEPEFPDSTVPDPARRFAKVAEEFAAAPVKTYEVLERSVRTSKVDAAPYLSNNYTNADEKMVCQCCRNAMPRKHDGNPYFEAVEAFDDDIPREHVAQYLALCPLCAAKYKEFVKRDDKVRQKLKEAVQNATDSQREFDIALDVPSRLRFTEPHLIDLRAVLSSNDIIGV